MNRLHALLCRFGWHQLTASSFGAPIYQRRCVRCSFVKWEVAS